MGSGIGEGGDKEDKEDKGDNQPLTTNQCTDVPWHVWYNNQQPTNNH